MDKIWAVSLYTFKESFARKTFIAFFVVSSIVLALFLFALNVDIVDGALASLSLFGNEASDVDIDLRTLVITIEAGLSAFLFTGGIFFSIFATASLIPNMLEKGNIDWVLAKPISREALLIGRFLGALAIVGFNIFYLIGGSWLILSMKTGIWHVPFLFSGVVILFMFAILYAFMALLGVTLQNGAVSIMGAYLVLFFSPMLATRDRIYALLSEKIYQYILDGIYYLMPRTFDIGNLVRKIVMAEPILSWEPVIHSALVGLLFFSLSVYIFKQKNF